MQQKLVVRMFGSPLELVVGTFYPTKNPGLNFQDDEWNTLSTTWRELEFVRTLRILEAPTSSSSPKLTPPVMELSPWPSLLHDAPKAWNSLPDKLRSMKSLKLRFQDCS